MKKRSGRLPLKIRLLIAVPAALLLLCLYAGLLLLSLGKPPSLTHGPSERLLSSAPTASPPVAGAAQPSEGLPPLDLRAADRSPRPFRGQTERLDNGMTVILVEDHSTPTVAVSVAFRLGSAHDPPGQEGAAHLLEHLMSYGTTRLGTTSWRHEAPAYEDLRLLSRELALSDPSDPDTQAQIEQELAAAHSEADQYGIPKELSRLLDEIGATDINASTSFDRTEYHATLPGEALLPWAVAMSEQLYEPVLRGFINEREVVVEEIRMRQPCTGRWFDLRGALFEGHPYARPIGGDPESLAAIDIPSLEDLFYRGYGPENALVVLVGDINPPEALSVIEQTFGLWERRPTALPEVPTLDVPVGSNLELPPGPGKRFSMAFQLPPLSHAEAEAMSLLGSILQRRLSYNEPDRLVLVDHTRQRAAEMFVVELTCGEPAACEREILSTLGSLEGAIRGLPFDLTRARTWVQRLEQLEQPNAQAAKIVEGWVRGETLGGLWSQLAALRALTPEQMALALDRLQRSRYAAQPPDGSQPPRYRSKRKSARTAGSDAVSRFYLDTLALPRPPAPPRWLGSDSYRIERGGLLIATPNPSNTLFEVGLTFERGWLDDPRLCLALRNWSLALPSWGEHLYRSGISAEVTACGPLQSTIALSGPSERDGEALEAALRSLAAPKIQRLLGVEQAHSRLVSESRLLPYPVSLPSREELERIDIKAVEASLEALSRHSPRATYTGPSDASALAALLPGALEPLVEEPAHTPLVRDELTVSRVSSDLLRVVRISEPYDPKRESLYTVYERWLKDYMRDELRSESGLSYVIDARYQRGRTAGEHNRMIFTAQSSRGDVILVALSALKAIHSDAERFARAWSSAEQHAWSDDTRPRLAPERVAAWLDRGWESDPQEAAWEGMKAVDLAAFERFLAEEAARPMYARTGRPSSDPAAIRAMGVQILEEP